MELKLRATGQKKTLKAYIIEVLSKEANKPYKRKLGKDVEAYKLK